jgi:hypothetical protein
MMSIKHKGMSFFEIFSEESFSCICLVECCVVASSETFVITLAIRSCIFTTYKEHSINFHRHENFEFSTTINVSINKRSLGRYMTRWEDNIKVDLKNLE